MATFAPCAGATSDHAWRLIQVELVNKQNQVASSIRGATWNMQMKCLSAADAQTKYNKPYSNNPLDITETDDDYFQRKRVQLVELETLLQKNSLNFVFLQEADWVNNKNLLNEFTEMLRKYQWDMVVTPRDKQQQPFVTLYNTLTLEPDPTRKNRGLLPNSAQKFRAYEANFVSKANQAKWSLVNLHLEYGRDYRNELLELQKKYADQDVPCILGGDTNNVQNEHLPNMIGDWNAATNISRENNRLTTIHQPRQDKIPAKMKTYDGFFVTPGRHTFAQITELGGKKFVETESGVQYVDYLPQHATHTSFVGMPWLPKKDLKALFIDLNAAIQALKDYGQSLKPSPAGDDALDLAESLKNQVEQIIAKDWKAVDLFKQKLNQGYEKMGEHHHPGFFHQLLISIARAFNALITWISQKQIPPAPLEFGQLKPAFFSRTSRQTLLMDIKNKFDHAPVLQGLHA